MKFMNMISVFSLMLLQAGVFPTLAKPPENAKIVFVSNRDGNQEIYIMDTDGGQQRNLTRHFAEDFSPTWSPTGEQILFVSDRRKGIPDLYLMDPEGSNVRRVFKEGAHREQPTWAPDGKRIAYLSHQTHTLNIATIDGDLIETLTPIGASGRCYPDWSPDGIEIAFDWAIRGKIRILNLQTLALDTFQVNQKFVMFSPAWSPEGSKLTFAGVKWPENHVGPLRVGEKATIYIVNRDGSQLEKIIRGVNLAADSPVWSPQVDALLYHRKVIRQAFNDGRQIFKIALGFRFSEQLTQDGSNYMADWFDPAALPVLPQSHLLTTTWGRVKKETVLIE